MTEGGIVEYEFVTAIAELIDNSIEHSLDIDGDRNIVFEINTDVDRVGHLFFSHLWSRRLDLILANTRKISPSRITEWEWIVSAFRNG